jgi:hypothetical protein
MLHVSHQDPTTNPLCDDNTNNNAQFFSIPDYMYRHGIVHELRDSIESNIRTTAPELDIAYTSQASMISLPSQLNLQPMISLLNAEDAALYSHPSTSLLLTATEYNQLTEQLHRDSKLPGKPKIIIQPTTIRSANKEDV